MDDGTTDGRPGRAPRAGRHAAAVAVAVLALAALVWAVGVEEVHAVLAGVHPRDAAILVLAGLVPVAAWGVELRLILRGIGQPVGTVRALGLFAAAGFLNNVTPMGELGGDVPSGLLIAGDRGIPFERGLAAITSLNVLNRVAVVGVGVVGLAWLGRGALPVGWAPVAAILAWVTLAGALAVAWTRREAIVRRLGPPLASAVVRIGGWVPLVGTPAESAVEARLRGFVDAVDRLAADPRRLGAALLLGLVGHLAAAATLWLALGVLGAPVPVRDVLLVVPLAKTSGLSPTPGGTGTAPVVVAGLLVALTSVDASTATGAALLYRAAAFWVPTALGGAVTVSLVGGLPAR